MPDLPTRLDYFRIGANEVLSRSEERPPGQRISPNEVYTGGSDINIVIASASAMAEEVTRQLSLRINALLLDGARGEDLDRLVQDRFSVTVVRKGATPAVGEVELFRTGGALPAVNLPAGTKVKATDGTEFEFTSAASVPAGSTTPVTVPVQASSAGLTGNVAANTVTIFVAQPPDPELRVTNPDPMAGGAPTETDASLRERARSFYRTARRGTLAAIEFGALTVPGVAQATGYEVTDPITGLPTGEVFLFITDQNGNANNALVQAVEDVLLEWRAAGIPVLVRGTQPQEVDIVFNLKFQAGFDSNLVFQQVQNAVLSFVNILPPGTPNNAEGPGVLRESDLLAIARGVPGTIVLADAVQTPEGDLVPDDGKVLRTSRDRITNI